MDRHQAPSRATGAGSRKLSGALPTFVIIGAQKCGTTSLHAYLDKHPETSMSQPKELNFFIERRNWGKGLDWYRSHFDPAKDVRGESSPNYTAAPNFPGVPEKMASVIPDAKLIFMVRDPIDRIRSEWIHNYAKRNTDWSIGEAIRRRKVYVNRSKYNMQLQLYLEHFPRERILIIDQIDLLKQRRETLQRVFRFLGIDTEFWDDSFEQKRLSSSSRRRTTKLGYLLGEGRNGRRLPGWLRRWSFIRREFEQPPLPADVEAELKEQLADDAAAFRLATGMDFPHWKV